MPVIATLCVHFSRPLQFTEVEALGLALRGSHVQFVDYRAMRNLTRSKKAAARRSGGTH